MLEDNLKALIKPQYVDHIPKAIKGELTVEQMLDSKEELGNKKLMCDELELNEVLTRKIPRNVWGSSWTVVRAIMLP